MKRNSPLLIGVGLLVASAGGAALNGCNNVTGADRIVMSEEDDSANASSGAGASSASGGPSSGSGNTTSTGGNGGASGATGPASNAASSSNAQASSSSGSTQPCEYPPGPYGVAQGATLPPTLSWQVLAPGSSTPSTLTTADLLDCNGTNGRDVLVFDTSQYG